MDYTQSPQYQRWVQKIYRMSPHQRAVLSTAMADEAFASAEMQKKLRLMEIGANKKYLSERLALERKGMDIGYGLSKEKLEFGKRQSRIGETLGIANVLTSGYLGYTGMKRDIATSELLRRLTAGYQR